MEWKRVVTYFLAESECDGERLRSDDRRALLRGNEAEEDCCELLIQSKKCFLVSYKLWCE